MEDTNTVQSESVSNEPVTTSSEAPKVSEKFTSSHESNNSSAPSDSSKPKSFRSTLKSKLSEPVSKDPIAAKPSAAVATSSAPVAAAPITAEPQSEPILAPGDMSKEEREIFNQAPAALQKYLSRRIYELRTAHQRQAVEIGEKSREIDSISNAIKPFRDDLARRGIVPDLAVQRALAWDKALVTNDYGQKVQAAKEWLDSYGIHPSELMDGDGAPPQQNGRQQQQAFDPSTIDQLVEQRLEARFQKINQEKATEESSSALLKFIESKPLFRDPGTAEQLEHAMAPIVTGLRTSNPNLTVSEILERSYNYVVRGDDRFAELNARLNARTEAERTNAEATKALSASRSISGGPGSGTPKRTYKNFRDNLRANLNGAA